MALKLQIWYCVVNLPWLVIVLMYLWKALPIHTIVTVVEIRWMMYNKVSQRERFSLRAQVSRARWRGLVTIGRLPKAASWREMRAIMILNWNSNSFFFFFYIFIRRGYFWNEIFLFCFFPQKKGEKSKNQTEKKKKVKMKHLWWPYEIWEFY